METNNNQIFNNKAIVDMDEYLKLKEFKDNIIKNNIVKINTVNWGYREISYTYYNKEQFIDEATKTNKELLEKIKEMEGSYENCFNNAENYIKQKFTEYSLFEFLLWRYRYKKQLKLNNNGNKN